MLYTQVRAFDAVARAGSFLAAAEVLGLSQPALSIQVRALEDAYGVKLFHRHGRTVRLTTAGKELLELSRRFMSLEQQIAETLSASKGLGRGRLNLAFDGPHITMPLLSRFRALHPDIEVSVSMGNTRFVRQQLIERHVDLAVLPGVGEDSKIHAIPIKHHAPVVIVGPGHRWRDRAALDVHEIAREPMVARESGSNTQRRLDEGLKELGLTPRIVLRLGSREAVMEAVAADLGIGIVWEVEAQASTRVRSIPLTGSTIKSVDYLACMKDEVGRRVIKAFFSVLKEDARVTRTRHASARERPANAA